MRRTWKWLTALVCVAVLGIAVLWVLSRQPGVTRTNAERLTRGGTLTEVEARLGGPAGVYTSDGENWAAALPTPEGRDRKLWVGDDGAAVIDFNDDGRVMSVHWLPRQESVWTAIRNIIGL
jgi:hypothetical protein